MAVGAADARRLDPHQHVAGTGVRCLDVNGEDVVSSQESRATHSSFHSL
jgi:hypothetical protein